MARKKGRGTVTGPFGGWATPMSEPKIHATDPYIEPDNAMGMPRAPRMPYEMLFPKKDRGYNIGTGGVRNSGRWHVDGRKGK